MAASVTKSFTQAILCQLDRQGIKLDASLLTQLDNYNSKPRLPMQVQDTRWRALEVLRMPELGLRIGTSMLPQHFDTIGFLLLSSPSLSSAVDGLVDYSPIIGEGGKFSKSHTESGWQLRYDAQFVDAIELRIEAIFSSITQGARWITGKPVAPVCIKFKHGQHNNIAAYRHVFGNAEMLFNQPHNAIIFSDNDWTMSEREVNPAVQTQMIALAQQQLTQLQPQNMIDKVTLLLSNQPWLNRAQLAARLALSERSLSRQLQHAGTNYQNLAQHIRKHYAIAQIKNENVTQASLAKELGYNDESAFAKAFKRWTGLGFREFRQQDSRG